MGFSQPVKVRTTARVMLLLAWPMMAPAAVELLPKHAETRYVLVDPGRSYIASADHLTGRLGVRGLPAGRCAITRLDCQSGRTAAERHTLARAGDHAFEKPPMFGTECAAWIRFPDLKSSTAARASGMGFEPMDHRQDADATEPAASENRPPVVDDQRLRMCPGATVYIQLKSVDDDGPGPYSYTIVRPPAHGTLSGDDNDRVYIPTPGFAGTDQFTWKVNDGVGESKIAVVAIMVSPDVSEAIDYQTPAGVSKLEIGVTHTHAMWENGHPDAVARVKKELEGAKIRYQNQHIMGWGVNNPEPSPGVYSWSSLDRRLDLIRSMADTIPVITFCTAPGWMKASGKDWNMEERVADEHVQDFAGLCRAVALRYRDVEYFQIWNEFKGYWIKGGRDVERFTVLYNAVHDAVKGARPDAKIGGPYLSMRGRSLSANDRQVMDYWRRHSRGCDFLTFDGWLEGWPPGGKTEDWMTGRRPFFGDLVKEFRAMMERPVWISEFYGGRSKNPQFTAANHASCYYHALQSGARLALLWDGVGLGQLFPRTQAADGGRPTPHYFVVRAFNQHFGPGTQLYKTTSSSDDLEVLASRAKIMLINKRPDAVSVNLEGKKLTLEGYEVRVLDTP
jgi:hypothetical protein